MFVVANTDELMAEGVIDAKAADIMQDRARGIMVNLAINAVLCFGILAATGGLIFWLADAFSVAVVGVLLLVGGLSVLAKGGATYAMFGNAAALIGAGMLIGGAAIELLDKYPVSAGWAMTFGGAVVAAIAARALWQGGFTARFVQGAILLMGIALHLFGIGYLLEEAALSGLPKALFYLYATFCIFGAGWLTDVRLVSALAIVPFAQMLDTGTSYFHAAYVFSSPESTLTILQMTLAMLGLAWLMRGRGERGLRHARIFTIMAFVVANLAALVGSLWGDHVGDELFGPERADFGNWQSWNEARTAFNETLPFLSADLYSILWAIVLAGLVFWAAHKANRGLFNAAITFAGIHGYTQLFESFGDEPLAWVIGGAVAIPLAWGMWRLNQNWIAKRDIKDEGQI